MIENIWVFIKYIYKALESWFTLESKKSWNRVPNQ